MKFLATVFLVLGMWSSMLGQDQGHEIKVFLENNENDTLYMAYFYGDNQYVTDTAVRNSQDAYVFSKKETLKHGIYILVLPPKNEFFQFMVEDSQNITIKADAKNIVNTIEITGSPLNVAFYDYLKLIEVSRVKKQSVMDSLNNATDAEKSILENKIVDIDRQVLHKQDELMKSYDGTLLDIILASSREPDIPSFDGLDKEEKQRKAFQYYHDHYFDNVPLDNDIILRTPFIHNKVMTYIDQYTYQIPDSINRAIDVFLSKIDEDQDLYRFFLIKFLNKYANSKVIGFDAIYVHLAQNYYGKGKAPWIDEETLVKILDNAERFSYTLIGKDAPEIRLYDVYNEREITLNTFKGNYTVMIFWSPTCNHCQKVMPTMPDIIKKFSNKNVKFVSICTKADESCKTFVDENIGESPMFHSLPLSNYGKVYDVRSTPKIFVVSPEGKIASKGLAVEQIEEVVNLLIESDESKASKNSN
ncbi:TlpA family protein disulfide reductase [Membranihabitans marinus]|uniref:TlpA family protein disulfide reductase n=1 Tax=Membranihabitans marinus TaxID=1227546 RepID=UPI001F37189D|nr:TlpA family protein disulfide reductase [Membranihabitans marinus]